MDRIRTVFYHLVGILTLIINAFKTNDGLARILTVLLIVCGVSLLYYTITTIIYMNTVLAQGI